MGYQAKLFTNPKVENLKMYVSEVFQSPVEQNKVVVYLSNVMLKYTYKELSEMLKIEVSEVRKIVYSKAMQLRKDVSFGLKCNLIYNKYNYENSASKVA